MNARNALILLTLTGLLLAGCAGTAAPQATPQLTVSGTGIVRLTPDLATINLGVVTQDTDVAQAEARCDDYTQVRAGMLARKADPYRIRVLDFGLRYHRLRCAWITELLAGLDRQRRPSPSPRRRRR